jgi:hypothetical protein
MILYSPGHGLDGNWVDGSAVPCLVWQQNYHCKPLPSQLIVQQEMDKDAMVLMVDDITLKSFSPS